MLILRNDDILNNTRSGKFKGKEVDRLKFINKMVNETHGQLVHYPTILCTDIEQYPEAIEYIKNETKLGRMIPQLHGWEHKDYVHCTEEEIREMILKAKAWFNEKLETDFTIWATPWGGKSKRAVKVCDKLGVILQSTDLTFSPGEVLHAERNGGAEKLLIYPGKNIEPNITIPSEGVLGITILYHWWERGLNLFRLCEILKHGSWEAAKEVDTRGWFK